MKGWVTVMRRDARDRMRPLFSAGLVALLAAAGPARAGDGFVEEIPATFKAVPLHRRHKTIGGLGFDVGIDGWPRLKQRGFLDVVDSRNGTREVHGFCSVLDLGQVRTGPGAAQPKPEEATWCYRKYGIGGGAGAMEFYISRLTPAFLVITKSPALEVFAGQKWLTLEKFRLNPVLARVRPERSWTGVPAHVAYPTRGGVIVKNTSGPVPLSDLSEPWALFWFGESSKFFRTNIPNILWRIHPKLFQYMEKHYFIPADLPVLVVFQKKPRELRPGKDALALSFGAEGAGAVAFVPVLGLYHPPAEETKKWAVGLPEEIAEKCSAWARRLKHFPLSCTESRRVGGGGSAVTVRDRFTFLDLPDDWRTRGEKLAPVPPVVAAALRYGLPVELGGRLAPQAIPTHSGPFTGLVGSDTAEYTVKGLERYLAEEVASTPATGEDAKALAEELRGEVAKMIEAGPLAPAMSIFIYRMEFHFANSGETALALAEAMPYLDAAGREAAVGYAFGELRRLNPLTTQKVPVFKNTRREYFVPLTPQQYRKVSGTRHVIRGSARIPATAGPDNIYALWALGSASGEWEELEEIWTDAKNRATACRKLADWATCGYFYEYGVDRGSTAAANGRFARWVALWRLASRFGDAEARDHAAYRLARTALFRFAQSKVARYMYDEKFQVIGEKPDWMYDLSTCYGEAGAGLLWTDQWAGADDDVRQCVRWDQFGPAIAQAFGDHWNPIQPTFQNLTPECGRFLADHLADDCRRFLSMVERNAPAWHVTRRLSYIGKENSMDSPRNSYALFLGKCYALGADGKELLKNQDAPFCRVGDLYHIRRITANLRAFGGLKWKKVR